METYNIEVTLLATFAKCSYNSCQPLFSTLKLSVVIVMCYLIKYVFHTVLQYRIQLLQNETERITRNGPKKNKMVNILLTVTSV